MAKALGVGFIKMHDTAALRDESDGRFAHILDPERCKIELWEPKPIAGA
jgi:hypothetical protein